MKSFYNFIKTDSKDTFSLVVASALGFSVTLGLLAMGIFAPGLEYAMLAPIVLPPIAFVLIAYSTYVISRLLTSTLFGFDYVSIVADPKSTHNFKFKHENKNGILDFFSIHAPFKTTVEEIVEQLGEACQGNRQELTSKVARLKKEAKPEQLTNNRSVKSQQAKHKQAKEAYGDAVKELVDFDNRTKTFMYEQTKNTLRTYPDSFYPSETQKLKNKAYIQKLVDDSLYQRKGCLRTAEKVLHNSTKPK